MLWSHSNLDSNWASLESDSLLNTHSICLASKLLHGSRAQIHIYASYFPSHAVYRRAFLEFLRKMCVTNAKRVLFCSVSPSTCCFKACTLYTFCCFFFSVQSTTFHRPQCWIPNTYVAFDRASSIWFLMYFVAHFCECLEILFEFLFVFSLLCKLIL